MRLQNEKIEHVNIAEVVRAAQVETIAGVQKVGPGLDKATGLRDCRRITKVNLGEPVD